MNDRIGVVTWEGYSASSRENKNTISVPLKNIINNRDDSDRIVFVEISTSNREESLEGARDKIIYLKAQGIKYFLFVGKSYGCVRIKKFLEKYKDDDVLKDIEYDIEMIDAHGALAGDGEVGPYNKRQPMELNEGVRSSTKIVGISQEDPPSGAIILSDIAEVENVYLGEDFDHYSIINSWAVRDKSNELLDDLFQKAA